MKKSIISLSILFSLILVGQITNAQEKNIEKKIEKRVKIVTIDENGQKVVIDTVYHGDMEDEDLMNNMMIDAHGHAKVIISDSDKEVHSHSYETKSGHGKAIFITVDENSDSGKRVKMKVDSEELGENERIIIIKSAEGVEEFIIKGDATITIKDGNLEVESSSEMMMEVEVKKEMMNKKEMKREIIKEKEVKKSKKK